MKQKFALILGLVLLAAGCNQAPSQPGIYQNSQDNTQTPQSQTPSPTPTPENKPTAAPTPEQTPTITPTQTQNNQTNTQTQTPNFGVSTHYASLNLTSLALGDNKISASAKTGYVYSCQSSFTGGGAEAAGSWIHGSTWNLKEKTSVQGKVYWPNATFNNTLSGTARLLSGNGLPFNQPTGTFPIAQTDPAWQIDRNPNSIQTQSIAYSLPINPKAATAPACLPMGAIGIALDGVAIFNALDDGGRDAVAREVQDLCQGHPQQQGEYHYHGPSNCMPNADKKNTVVGYALDGFPITSLYDNNGHYYTNADLDACHGKTDSYVDENGTVQTGYHYVLTQEYPYTLGCFMATPIKTASPNNAQTQTNNQPAQNSSGQGAPPQAAIGACSGKTLNSSCSFNTPNGQISGSCKIPPGQSSLACVP